MNALYVICGLGVASLIAEIFSLRKWLVAFVMVGLVSATVLVALEWDKDAFYYSHMLRFDNFAVAFTGLICGAAVLWFWMAASYFHREVHVTDEAALILFCLTGAVLMASFANMAMLFLGVEILSISLYIMAGSRKESLYSNEASFKYFLMGSFATGFLLMGIALVYGATGSFYVTEISGFISSNYENLPSFFYVGIVMIMIGMLFKASAVPFHFWAPDVYQGSPTIVTAFMSTVVKIAAVAALFRLFANCFAEVSPSWLMLFKIVMVLTLVVANVTAVYQSNVKRMLAYSSVGHIGYILLAFVSGIDSMGIIFYYLAAYAVASLGAFAVLVQFEKSDKAPTLESFNGLFRSNSFLAVSMTVALLSLAGIPPLAGFFGKYLVFVYALKGGNVEFVLLAAATSAIGIYYYFKVIIAMFTPSETSKLPLSLSSRVEMILLVLLTLVMGILPDFFRIL